jgi:lipopolysaccharide export system protein LptA
MKRRKQDHPALRAAFCLLLLAAAPAHALKSDRQQPLDVRADSTDGTLGDGTATLRGNVEIRQGTLLIRADVAAVEKAEGRVRRFELTGNPVHLQQEIEEEGLVSARARKVEYEVASGIVTLTGAADVDHPQYQINGEVLRYDMNAQHFQGSGGDEDGRIRIQLDPEVVPGEAPAAAAPAAETRDPPADADSG